MRYQAGSEAVRLDAPERRRHQNEKTARNLEVINGAGLDAGVRQGVSPKFLARLKVIVAAVCVFVVIGCARVALTSATVSALQANSSLRSQIKTAQSLQSDLVVQRSVLTSSSRIVRIATQNYGMVLATSSESLVITGAQAADATSGEEATASQDATANAASTGAVDGESAQGETSAEATPDAA